MGERPHCPECGWPLRARGLAGWYCLRCEMGWTEGELGSGWGRRPEADTGNQPQQMTTGDAVAPLGDGEQLGLFDGEV